LCGAYQKENKEIVPQMIVFCFKVKTKHSTIHGIVTFGIMSGQDITGLRPQISLEIDLDRAAAPEPQNSRAEGQQQLHQSHEDENRDSLFVQSDHTVSYTPIEIDPEDPLPINREPKQHINQETVLVSRQNSYRHQESAALDQFTQQVPGISPDHLQSKRQSPVVAIKPSFPKRLTSTNAAVYDEINSLRKKLATESKTSTEYTLHILFTQFVRHAERKLNLCLTYPLNREPPIVDLLSEGVDPEFDNIIASLGYISRNNPKPVIDSVMFWRKSKSEVAVMAADAAETAINAVREHKESSTFKKQHSHSSSTVSRFSHRRNNSSKTSINNIDTKLAHLESQVQSSRETAIQAERKSIISIYILCRVLIEVVKQVNFETTGDDLGDKLEDIVFSQLRSTDPILISSSIIRSANWNFFAELLGYMSDKRFLSVSDRFIADLEKIPAVTPKEIEPSIHLLIHGMRYLKLRNYPLEDFEESADFLQSIAKFYKSTRSHSIKLAYSQVLTHILLPLAETLTAEVNHPTWSDAISTIFNCIDRADPNQKSWLTNFTLATAVLSVAPNELFLNNWYELIEAAIKNLKLKSVSINEKITIATSIARLIWVYMFRCTETLNNTTRKIESIMKSLILNKSKQSWFSTDAGVILPLVQIFRALGYTAFNQTVENYVIPLIKQAFHGSSLDNIQHEKMTLAIKSYVAMLADTEKPLFPENPDIIGVPDVNINFKSSNHDEIARFANHILNLLDTAVGPHTSASSESSTPTLPFYYSSKSPFSGFKFGSDTTGQTTKNLNTELFAVLIESIPWLSMGVPRKVIELLCRNSLHHDYRVSSAASRSLRLLISKKNSSGLISIFANYAFNFTERSGNAQNYIISKELLKLYLDLLENWLKSIKERKSKTKDEDFISNGKKGKQTPAENEDADIIDEMQIKNTITVIEEVEGHGLFFLSSHDFEIRRMAISILKITESFDEALYEQTTKSKLKVKHSRSNSKFAADIGTRVIFILQSIDFFKLINSQKAGLSVPERSRLSKLNLKTRRNVMCKLAESDYGIDSALWFRVFPMLLVTIFEKCPITMALCRSIVCSRLVQIHELILEIADSPRSTQRLGNGPPEVLVEQWKLYLIVACTSLTSTSEQRLHIPEAQANGKKKSQQLLTIQHSTITSAKSVFKLTLNLLTGSNQVVKDAIITGLSCMNINIFKTFIEVVDPVFESWELELGKNFSTKDSRLRVEVTHVLNIVSKFLEEDSVINDDWIVLKLVGFIKTIKSFLSKSEVQHSFEFQKLRRYFCGLLENVYSGLLKRSDHTEWFPFEARVSCFTFLEEWCGYGKSSIIAKQRYAQMAKHTTDTQELTALNSAIEFERQILTIAATKAMVALLNGTIQELRGQTLLRFDLPGLLSWIDLLFASPNERIQALAKKALNNMFQLNSGDQELYTEVFKKCIFDQKTAMIEKYFTVIADALIRSEETYSLQRHQVLLFALYGIGFSSYEIRSPAINLLVHAENKLFGQNYSSTFAERVKNKNKTIYKRALLDISTYFASSYPEENVFLISELTRYFHIVSFESRRDLLTILLPWLQTVELTVNDDDEENWIDLKSYMVLSNLFEITIKFSDAIPNEIEALWISLGNGNNFNNAQAILKFAIQTSLVKRNPLFVEFASKVLVYVSGSNMTLVDTLAPFVDHKNMVPPKPKSLTAPTDELGLPYIADIWKVLDYPGKDAVFSLGHLSLIFLSDLVVIPKESLSSKAPLLLHVSFALLDHYLPIVQESASKMIIYTLSTVPSHPKLESTKELIRNNQKSLWVYDDLNNDRNGARSPKDMDLLVRNIIEIFSSSHPSIQEEWGRVALSWSTNCAVRHIACRSFQVFRSLLSFLGQSMLRDMLHRLSNTISDESSDIQGFAMQILMTLNAITSELDASDLISFPQLFWATVASLNTINEYEYIELLSVLTKFLSKIDLDSEDTVSCLAATFPSNWEGKFEGLQQIIMIGLRSSNAWDASLQLLDRLNKLQHSDIIAGPSRLLFALLANIPRYLHALELGDISPEIYDSAETLGNMATAEGHANLSRIIESFSRNRFRTKDDFLRQTVNFISQTFLLENSGQTLIFFLGLLSNKIDWVKAETMNVLKVLFPKIDLSEPQFQGCGADLISPLLRLLLTPYAQQALEVLDETNSISGSKLDKDILRMSLGNTKVKKDYEKTATLFGIPEDSGWSIAMPAITAATTRNNVHAVFTTCAALVESEEPHEEQEQIKFHLDEYRYDQDEQNFTYGGYQMDSISVAEENDGSLSNMWAELDNLDSFFTKDAENSSQYSGITSNNGIGSHFRSTSMDTRYSNTDNLTPFESAPQIYDKKVSVILNRSLARTQSNTSFRTSLADSFGRKAEPQ
jgi:hypothetical protein